MMRRFCLRMCRTREDSSLQKVMMSVLSLTLVGLQKYVIAAQGLPLNEAHIILGWIFSMLFSNFKARGLKSNPTTPLTALNLQPPNDFTQRHFPTKCLIHLYLYRMLLVQSKLQVRVIMNTYNNITLVLSHDKLNWKSNPVDQIKASLRCSM